MAGHSHWKQIKYKKAQSDQKRSQLFSKLLNAISVAAKQDPNPEFNPRLRTAIEKAKENNVPQENIERAIEKAKLKQDNLEELLIEAYAFNGVPLIIEAITDNKNRTISQIKSILKDFEAKIAEPGSVLWAFNYNSKEQIYEPKYFQEIDESEKEKILKLLAALDDQDEVQDIYTNINLE